MFKKIAQGMAQAIAIVLLGLYLTGCVAVSPADGAEAPTQPPGAPALPTGPAVPPTLTVTATDTIVQEDPVSQDDSHAQPQVTQAKQDLAGRLNLSLDEIELVEFAAVIWPDASLGCPQQGMLYAQVLQEGARIVLRAGDTLYAYHSGGARAPFLCENPTPPVPGRGAD
jgi:hypothetical protein